MWPLALLATIVGLRFTRPLAARRRGVRGDGVLLVPSVEFHERIDRALSGAHHGAHNHEDVGSGLFGMLEHGLHDALLAQAVIVPLAIFVFTSTPWRMASVGATRVRSKLVLGPLGLVLLGVALGGLGLVNENSVPAAGASNVKVIKLTDNPGNWFDTGQTIAGTRSLVVVPSGTTVRFDVSKPDAMTVHTATSLLSPTGASSMPFDQEQAFRRNRGRHADRSRPLRLRLQAAPVHARGIIVDDPATPELDLGKTLTLMNGATVPSASDLALRLVRAFFNITSPGNYQVHSAAKPTTWTRSTRPSVRAFDKDGIRRHPEPRRLFRQLLPRAGHPPEGHGAEREGRR